MFVIYPRLYTRLNHRDRPRVLRMVETVCQSELDLESGARDGRWLGSRHAANQSVGSGQSGAGWWLQRWEIFSVERNICIALTTPNTSIMEPRPATEDSCLDLPQIHWIVLVGPGPSRGLICWNILLDNKVQISDTEHVMNTNYSARTLDCPDPISHSI